MKKIIFFAIAVVILASGVAGTIFFFKKREAKDDWLCQNGVWIKRGNPSSPMPLEPCLANQNSAPIEKKDSNPSLIGNDRDEHGCLTAAGYRWCEPKQKCLRNWEEICVP